jgi:hypothetical protein
VTAAELLPALAPIPATAGLQSQIWEQLPVPKTSAAGGSSSGNGAHAGASGGLPVSLPVLAGGVVAAVAAIVAAVALLGGGGGNDGATPDQGGTTLQVTGGIFSSATAAATQPGSAPVPTTLDAPVPPGKLLVFEHDGAYYLPADGTVSFPAHPPNCSYEHLHGPPMRALLANADGTYAELAEFEGECGFGTPDGTLFLVDEPA